MAKRGSLQERFPMIKGISSTNHQTTEIQTSKKTTKAVKEISVGDRVAIVEPDGVAEVRLIERSRLFQASGGCFRLDMKVIAGPNKGQWIKDQHHGGDEEISLAS